MPSERRSEEELRREIATEREQLAAALADLRAGIDSSRRRVAVAGGTLVAGLAAATILKVARRRKGE